MSTLLFNKLVPLTLVFICTLLLSTALPVLANEKDEHGKPHEETTDKIMITPASIVNAEIENSTAQAGTINQNLTLYGKTIADASQVSQVRARFAGMISKLTVNIGDKVTKGEVIAEIESSSSLQRYAIKAPISGIVTARFANENELADRQVLLTITNTEQLWLELQVFPSQRQQVAEGDSVIINSDNVAQASTIKYLLPSDNNQTFSVARVAIDNTNKQFSPGLLLQAQVVINQLTVDLSVENSAIQTVAGKSVVFVKTVYGYQARPVDLGSNDAQRTQVLSGLIQGESYAATNSYLLKAELEKSLAGGDDHH